MPQPLFERVLKAERRLADEQTGSFDGQWTELAHDPIQVEALERFEDDVMDAAHLGHFKDVGNVEVRQFACRVQVLMEPGHGFGPREPIVADYLERHEAFQVFVASLKERADGAVIEPVEDEIGPDEQFGAASLANALELERRNPVAPCEFPCQVPDVRKSAL
jgi:hypothetical protein